MKKLRRLLIFIFLALIVIEVSLQVFLKFKPADSFYYAPHKVLGWAPVPKASYLSSKSFYLSRVSYNSMGLRSPEFVLQKNPDVFRILVFGASFLEGLEVGDDKHFSYLLERELNQNGKKFEVINFAVGGHSNYQQYLRFLEYGSKLRPDLILFGFSFSGDTRGNSKSLQRLVLASDKDNRLRPFLVREGNQWTHSPVDYSLAQKVIGQEKTYNNSLWGLQYTYRKLKRLLQREKLFQRLMAKDFSDFSDCNERAEYQNAWLVTEEIFSRFKVVAENIGAKLVVFTNPSPVLGQKVMLKLNENQRCLDHTASDKIAFICKKLGLSFLSLEKEFRAPFKINKRGLSTIGSLHWNSAGHKAMAATVAQKLKQNNFFND